MTAYEDGKGSIVMTVAWIGVLLFVASVAVGCGKSPGQLDGTPRDFSSVVPKDDTYVVNTQDCTSSIIHGRTVWYPKVLAYQQAVSQNMVALSNQPGTPDSASTNVSFYKWTCQRSYIENLDRELAMTQMTPEKEQQFFLALNSYRNDFVDIEIDRVRNGNWYGMVITRFIAYPRDRADWVMITSELYEENTNTAYMISMRIIRQAITVAQAKSIIASYMSGPGEQQ